MTRRVYLSNIWPLWPLRRQKAALAKVLADPAAVVYRDVLTGRTPRPESLHQRAEMLAAPPQPPETIWIASFAVLAVSEADLETVLTAFKARGARLICQERLGTNDRLERWHRARDKRRQSTFGKRNGAVMRDKMAAIYGARVETIRARWGNPAWTQNELLAEAKVSRNTANKYLGCTWNAALAAHRDEHRRAALPLDRQGGPPR